MLILDPGFLTMVQDLGRPRYQQYGVSAGGAMDRLALAAANALVGNAMDEAALEITMAGPRVQALGRCLVAVTGARFRLSIDGTPMAASTALFMRAGATLEFGERESGARAYLAVAGGFDIPPVLGSRSTDVRAHFGGFEGRPLRAGDRLPLRGNGYHYERAGRSLPAAFDAYYRRAGPLRFVWGPHFGYFSERARQGLLDQPFEIGELSDRMGIRLSGNPIDRLPGELLSCGVTFGAIQVPSGGQPIVLMADHQPTGGYPVIGTVIRADIPLLASKTAGDRIRFTAVDLGEARRAWTEIERMLRSI